MFKDDNDTLNHVIAKAVPVEEPTTIDAREMTAEDFEGSDTSWAGTVPQRLAPSAGDDS